ncbi:hypothetical protein KQX54_007856 [Cotesia glomerata]|uniref:Uncharacterized protein n=1 Tax=Cotesia glomerata TaxID=32391 RepID=A0AAV7I271_COTGL|nr:hypothetical protein KQX54_007856 [Cotesia glomerata]
MYIVRRVNTDGIVHRIEIDSESGSAEGVNPPLQPGRDDTRVVAGDFAGNLKHQLPDAVQVPNYLHLHLHLTADADYIALVIFPEPVDTGARASSSTESVTLPTVVGSPIQYTDIFSLDVSLLRSLGCPKSSGLSR